LEALRVLRIVAACSAPGRHVPSTADLILRAKFTDPDLTADGQARASVPLVRLRTLWFNTGTLCNLTCRNCYIESSPRNDALVYLTAAEVAGYLDELAQLAAAAGERVGHTEEIGFTGGEPFMNPDFMAMLGDVLARGYRALVLTNAMKPMMKCAEPLRALARQYGDALTLRVSLDHFERALHEEERGRRTWAPTLAGLRWLAKEGIRFAVAGRTRWGGDEASLRAGFAALFAAEGIALDCADPGQLVLFPEMDVDAPVPEITTACWGILHKSPADVMCATQRMVVKRKGAADCAVVACTLLPHDQRFDYGARLAGALAPVKLNHPHCAKFCVLGGGSCST
jgi:uncharacterized Fe-S cluster-containing radical SAM superfamily protein